MHSKRLLTAFVVVLVLTAGCLGGGGGDGDSGGDGAAAGGGSGGGSSSSGGDGGDGGAGSAGDGQSGDETFDLTDPEERLRNAGSFTVTWRFAGVDMQGSETEVTREFAADLEAGRSYTATSSMRNGGSDAATSEQFVADGVTYTRSGTDENPQYFSYEGDTDVVAMAIGLSQARAYGADDDMDYQGTETFDGVTVERYELSEASEALIRAGSVAGAGSPNSMEVTEFEYVVLVDEDGLSRYESWSYAGRMDDGTTVSGQWEYSLTGVGSTTVEDPDWLDEAKEGQ